DVPVAEANLAAAPVPVHRARSGEPPRTDRLGRQAASLQEEPIDAAHDLELAAAEIRGQQPVDAPGDRACGGPQPDALAEELDQRAEGHPLDPGLDLERLISRPAHRGPRLAAAV